MNHPTIFVVDDAKEHRHILTALLRGHGYQVVEVEDTLDAIVRSYEIMPDLLVVSFNSADARTLHGLDRLRSAANLADVPVLGANSAGPLLDRRAAWRLGLVDCVEKPFNVDYLLDRVTRALAPREVVAIFEPVPARPMNLARVA